MRVLLVLNGPPPSPRLLRREQAAAELVIAVDGGLAAFPDDAPPQYLTGDLDSAPERTGPWEQLELADPSKTDLEKTLLALGLDLPSSGKPVPYGGKRLPLHGKVTELIVLGGIGGRPDHFITNLFVLDRLADFVVVRLLSEDVKLHRATTAERLSLSTEPGQTISILPLRPAIASSLGLKWELDGDTLSPDGLVSQSNQATSKGITIRVSEGTAWVFLLNSSEGEG